eukprot:1477637-Prymnesium_polylepis.1
MPASIYGLGGVGHCFAAGRLSYVLGMQGPCTSMDTACSSGLVACHGALRAVQLDECQSALVAGVCAMFVPAMTLLYAMGAITSKRGRSHTFDKRADGFGRGEACSASLLNQEVDEPASARVANAAVRQDGKSASLTAPNGQAQVDLMRAAHQESGFARLTFIEAHGTGTALGDPIEARSIETAVGQLEPGQVPPVLGSTKANIGHSEPAAGVVGVCRVVLGLLHKEMAVNALLRVLNLSLIHISEPTRRS